MSGITFSQDNRLLAMQSSELGPHALLLTELDGHDAISRPFSFRIEFATAQADGAIRALLGKPITLWFGATGGDGRRPAHGLIRRLAGPLPAPNDMHRWRADVVPQLWFLTRTADCRIFQDMTIPDIIKSVFAHFNLTDYEFRGLLGSYPKLTYCVQYRETAFDFVSRLMEHVGMFYWHEQSETKHQLVISDNNKMAPAALDPNVKLAVRGDLGKLLGMEREFNYRTGRWTLEDFDFTRPATDLETGTPTTLTVPRMSEYEVYDYPGLYTDTGAGKQLSRLRIEQEEAEFHRIRGDASTPGFDAGHYTVLSEADPDQPDWKVLLTEVRHRASDQTDLVSQGGPPPTYSCAFTAIAFDVPYRPTRIAPRPFVHGPQTAKVTGPSGEEIYTDQYGRVKVRFHWDRNPGHDADENSSCWLRVAQVWAGQGWGAIHIPRIGQEVIVDFLEGDPDQPIITGCVYNGTQTVPYALPDNKTQSGIKSQSSLGGGGSNEFRFEDKKGSEEVWLHAQKDLNAKVLNNETRDVGKDRTTAIHKDESTAIDGNKTTTVKGNYSETVQGTETRSVTGNVSETFGANETRNVTGNVTEAITGSLSQTVVGGITVTTPAKITMTAVGGFSILAPGGTSFVDNFFDKTGGKNFQAYGMSLSINGMSVSMGAQTLNLIANSVAISSLKVDVAGSVFKNTPTEIKSVGDAIVLGVANLQTFGLVGFL